MNQLSPYYGSISFNNELPTYHVLQMHMRVDNLGLVVTCHRYLHDSF
uniref:Uncharacterized protein n=1 Tax=Arundo donax TaxID=35708 RepID=A0A0A9AB72_ARUDO